MYTASQKKNWTPFHLNITFANTVRFLSTLTRDIDIANPSVTFRYCMKTA